MIGRIWLAGFLLVSTILCADELSLALCITDLDGTALAEVKQGVPFLITVTVSGDQSGLGEPTILHLQKLDSCQRMPVATRILLVNGQQQIQRTYTYKVRIDASGPYALGPASFDLGSRIIQSSAVSFSVVPHAVTSHAEVRDPFLYVKANKESLVVGEQLLITIRLCYRAPLSNAALEPFTMSTFAVLSLGHPVSESFSYDGRTWSCMTYLFALYPQQHGTLVVPSLQAHGEREHDVGTRSLMSRFFFGTPLQKITMHSEPITIDVQALPESRSVQAVGAIDSFLLTIEKNTIDLSTATTLTMRVVGNSDMRAFGDMQLVLPVSLRAYDSQSSLKLDPKHVGNLVYTREWVLQGLDPGSATIGPQSLTIFDPVIKKYRVLTTKPINVTIKQEIQSKKSSVGQKFLSAPVSQPFVLPWWLLIIVTLIPMSAVFVVYLWRSYAQLIEKKRAFYVFKKTIRYAYKNHDVRRIPQAWFTLVARRLGESRVPHSLREFEHMLVDDLRMQWRYYVARIEQTAYQTSSDVTDFADLFEQTIAWLDIFKDQL